MRGRKGRRPGKRVVRIFGEDDTDRSAIASLLRALRSGAPKPMRLRKPLVLMRGRDPAARRRQAEKLAGAIRAVQERCTVVAVLAHEDADAVEDAHEALAATIEGHLENIGVPVVAVVPAFELETWWWLWPDAVAEVNAKWRRLTRTGEVGRIPHAKEALRRDLRPRERGLRTRDYDETDAPRIAEQVRVLGVVHQVAAKSRSWERARDRILALHL